MKLDEATKLLKKNGFTLSEAADSASVTSQFTYEFEDDAEYMADELLGEFKRKFRQNDVDVGFENSDGLALITIEVTGPEITPDALQGVLSDIGLNLVRVSINR